MAIIYSYPTVTPVKEDLILGTDVGTAGKPTKNFTIDSIIALVTAGSAGLGATIKLTTPLGDAKDPQTNANQPIINLSSISGTAGATFSSYTTIAGASISGQIGNGFTDFTSTRITGTLQTAAQPSVTSLGNLTGLVINGAISGTNVITSTTLAGASNTNIASTLAIKTYVDSNPSGAESLAATLLVGNTTGATKIKVDNTNSGVDFIDDAKLRLGTGNDFEIYHAAADNKTYLKETGASDLEIWSNKVAIKNAAGNEALLNATENAAVELYFDNAKKIETLTGGAKVTGAFQATTSGTFASLINTGTYSDSSGDVGTNGQLLSSTGTGTNWVTEVPLYNWSLEGTAIPSGTAVTVTDGTNITTTWDATNFDLTIATTGVPDGSGTANQVTFWSDANTLTGAAGLTFAGGASGKVTVAGELEAGTLSDGTFSGSAGTYTGGVSITSTDFVGALTGNASTATALASSGAIAISGDAVSTGGPHTYTSGGAVTIPTTIADTTVTGKVLTNLPTPTSGSIAASDTILAAMAKLQGQITSTTGLAYEGAWTPGTDATAGGTPDLRLAGAKVNGAFYICDADGTGTPNGDGTTPNSWKIGDWVIYVANGSATDEWQKLDQSNEVLGSGAANKIARWTGTNTLATGLISDDGSTVTIGNTGAFLVEGNTTLGNADSDTTIVKGPAHFEETLRADVGIGLGGATYGTAGQVLTSGGGAASVNTWTTPTTGTVTSVGLTETGDALTITNSPITSSGNINIAGAGAASQYINGELNLITFPTLDNYQYWILSDGTNTTNITSTSTATFAAAGTGIAVAENNGTITITGSENPGTGTALTLPVWEAGGATLGNSMVSQDAATGTKLTISSATPALIINDTTANKGDLKISRSLDATTYMSTGTATAGTYGTHVFSQTDGSSPRDILTLDASQNAVFAGEATFVGDVGIGDTNPNAKLSVRVATDKNLEIDDQTGLRIGALNNVRDAFVALKFGASSYEFQTGDATFNGDIILPTNAKAIKLGGSAVTSGIGIRNAGINSELRLTGNSIKAVDATTPTTPRFLYLNGDVCEINSNSTSGGVNIGNNSKWNGGAGTLTNLNVYGNLNVRGSIIHSGGGGGTAKGGTFTKLYTTGNAGTAGVAFTISRATTGVMIFDVMLTSDTSTACAVAKKFTVVKSYGASPLFNKILDTGPDFDTSDFTVAFAQDTTDLSIKCTITPVYTNTQKIGITLDLGFGNHDATVVMN